MSEIIKQQQHTEVGKPGPKPVLDDYRRQRVCGMIAMGASRREAAKAVGVHVTTISRAMDRDADFAQQMLEMEIMARNRPLRAMYDAVETHWRAAAWMLERKCPDEFGRRKPQTYTRRDVREMVDRLVEEALPMVPEEAHREAIVLIADRYIEELDRPPASVPVNPLMEFEAMEKELADHKQQQEQEQLVEYRRQQEAAAAERQREQQQRKEELEAQQRRKAEQRRKAK